VGKIPGTSPKEASTVDSTRSYYQLLPMDSRSADGTRGTAPDLSRPRRSSWRSVGAPAKSRALRRWGIALVPGTLLGGILAGPKVLAAALLGALGCGLLLALVLLPGVFVARSLRYFDAFRGDTAGSP
jgi:hypothetical protein